mgnify:CR=1 FL=1
MITQVFNRMNDVRDLCEKRCEQLRQLAKSSCRPVQRVHPLILSQTDSPPLLLQPTPIATNTNESAKIDRKQR